MGNDKTVIAPLPSLTDSKDRVPSAKDVAVLDVPKQGQMSWFSGMCMVIGMMIGSGIFSTPSKVLKEVNSPGVAVILWVMGGMVSLFGTFSYLELGTMIPANGGEQAYLNEAFKKPRHFFPFLFCWALVMCVRPGSAAADAIIFAKYTLHGFIPHPEDPNDMNAWQNWVEKALGVFCITSITLMNMFSTRLAIKIHDGLTLIKILTLLLITIMGLLVAFNVVKLENKPNNFANAFAGSSTNAGSYATALFSVFWAFDGWNNLNYSVGELKDPVKNLPKAAGFGVSIVISLYVLANVSYLFVLPAEDMMKASDQLAAAFFGAVFGELGGEKIMPVFIGLATYGAVCAMVFSAARVVQSAAKRNMLPFSDWLKKESRWGTPINALLFHYVLSLILIIIAPAGDGFDFLVELVGYPTWVFYGITVFGLVMMRKTQPHRPRPVKAFIPFSVLFILVAIFLSVFPFFPKPSTSSIPYWTSSMAGLSVILLGIPIWWFFVRNRNVSVLE